MVTWSQASEKCLGVILPKPQPHTQAIFSHTLVPRLRGCRRSFLSFEKTGDVFVSKDSAMRPHSLRRQIDIVGMGTSDWSLRNYIDIYNFHNTRRGNVVAFWNVSTIKHDTFLRTRGSIHSCVIILQENMYTPTITGRMVFCIRHVTSHTIWKLRIFSLNRNFSRVQQLD